MALSYYPRAGEVVLCHYDRTALGAEMIKSRPAVIVGPRLRRRGDLVGVVPLSTTRPVSLEAYHCEIVLDRPLPKPFDAPVMWAKCDMYSSVSLLRLDRFKAARGGNRQWTTGRVDESQLVALRAAVLYGLGFSKP